MMLPLTRYILRFFIAILFIVFTVFLVKDKECRTSAKAFSLAGAVTYLIYRYPLTIWCNRAYEPLYSILYYATWAVFAISMALSITALIQMKGRLIGTKLLSIGTLFWGVLILINLLISF